MLITVESEGLSIPDVRELLMQKVQKSMHFGHIFLLGLAKTVFLHCPPPIPKPREPPNTSNGLSVAAFCFKVKKKHISGHN